MKHTPTIYSVILLPGIHSIENKRKKKVKVLVAQLCLTLCDPMDCSLPGLSVHGILQARILEWVVIPFSRGSNLGLLHRRQILYHLRNLLSCLREVRPPFKLRGSPLDSSPDGAGE